MRGMPQAKPLSDRVARQTGSSRWTTIGRWLSARAPWLLATSGLLVMSVLLGLTWLTATPILDEIARFELYRLPKLQMLQTAKNSDLDASVALRNVLLVRDPELDRQELARYASALQSASKALERYADLSRQSEEKELLRLTLAERERLIATRKVAIAADKQPGSMDPDELTRTLQEGLDRYLERLERLQDYQAARVNALINEMASRAGSVAWLLAVTGLVMALTLLAVATAWRAQLRREVVRRDQRIASLHAQKNALVGEVHHRIKNHLQGLLGLVETHQRAGRGAPGADALTTLHGHVMALVGIHGLQARDPSKEVTVKDLLRRQVELVRTGMGDAPVAVSDDAGLEGVVLPQEAAVPMALIVTELLVNAIKHGDGSPVHVSVSRSDTERQVRIAVRNRLAGPLTLDWASGRGIGTGLSLVASLSEGVAQLRQESTSEEITMTLLVSRPGAAQFA